VASAGPYANNPPCSRQITTSTPHRSIFYRQVAVPDAPPILSKAQIMDLLLFNSNGWNDSDILWSL